jgi:hypothetical protein
VLRGVGHDRHVLISSVPLAKASSVFGSFSSCRATSTRSAAAPPESLQRERNHSVSESEPSALYSPDWSKRRTPVAKTASSGSMPVSRIWIRASRRVSSSASRTQAAIAWTPARNLSTAASK